MATLTFLLAHLLGDFVLQPERMVKAKQEGLPGLLAHAAVHVVASIVLVGGVFFAFTGTTDQPLAALGVVALVSLGVGAVHMIIDAGKIKFEKKRNRFVAPYLMDQLLHLVAIIIAGFVLESSIGIIVLDSMVPLMVVLGLCIFLIAAFAVELLKYQIRRKKSKRAKYKPSYDAMAKRVVIAGIVYGVFLIFAASRIAAFTV